MVEFNLRGHRVKEAIPETRTGKQAGQVETQIRQAIFDKKYNRASAVTRFADFVDNVYIPWTRENNRSYKDDGQRAARLKEFFGHRAIRDITPMLIEKFKSELRKSDSKLKRLFSPSTVNRYLQVLSRILSMAYENGIIDGNPMSRVKRLREPEPRQRYLNQYASDEEERLMKALAGYGEHVVALAELDLETGMRLGELLNRRWTDVDGANQLISITQTKNDKPRLVPLTKKAFWATRRRRGETRNTKVTRGYAHGVPQRLRDAVNSLEKGKRLISGTPTLRQVAKRA
ncbi:MAG TPA: tyrosine-type recombinase/integrase [Pyrinomonadaceae bacterium]|nr:tyrosine-type recombinase/integrase [Pyrinomonadaceae bacterium]